MSYPEYYFYIHTNDPSSPCSEISRIFYKFIAKGGNNYVKKTCQGDKLYYIDDMQTKHIYL